MYRYMTKNRAIEVLDMFLHKQCDLESTKSTYVQETVWSAVAYARDALKNENNDNISDIELPLSIKFNLLDDSCIQMAHAICRYYAVNNDNDIEKTVIDLKEVAEHILAYVKAEESEIERIKRVGRDYD